PLDRRTRKFDLGDGPLLRLFAPERKGDWTAAEHLTPALSGQDVLEFDVPKQRLGFGDKIVDSIMTAAGAANDDLRGTRLGFLGRGNGQWNLALFLLRTCVRDRSCRLLGRRGLLRLDHRGLNFGGGPARCRTSGGSQEGHCEQGQRSRVSSECVHGT